MHFTIVKEMNNFDIHIKYNIERKQISVIEDYLIYFSISSDIF